MMHGQQNVKYQVLLCNEIDLVTNVAGCTFVLDILCKLHSNDLPLMQDWEM